MLIPVIFKNGKSGVVEDSQLEILIRKNKIKKFLRLDGWATVGKSRLRGKGGRHDGSKRRKAEHVAKVLGEAKKKRSKDTTVAEEVSFEIVEGSMSVDLIVKKKK